MNLENDQWNIADEKFGLWLNGNKHVENLTTIDILKSTYFVFRKKQSDKLTNLCNQAFKLFKEEGERLLVYENNIMYYRKSDKNEPGYYERLTKEENENIINGILSGNQRVFNELYENEFPKVVSHVKKNSGNIDSAKDVFQDALVILIEKTYRMELNLTCSIKTYLFSICKILWSEQLRKDKKTISLNDSYDHYETDIVIVRHDDVPDIYDNVNIAIKKLGTHCQQILECYYYKNMSWDEIAKTLGYKSAASAKNQKYKYLEQIRRTVSYEVE
jgi:RNA polymerase sigma factor (sigma-70 family)